MNPCMFDRVTVSSVLASLMKKLPVRNKSDTFADISCKNT